MRHQRSHQNLDKDGYRKNVGIIVCNSHQQVLWARRVQRNGWQFPQGGIEPEESARDAAFRELYEEIGLKAKDVKLLGNTENWLRYDVPYANKARHYLRARSFRGQKQRWFLFQLVGTESRIRLDRSNKPDFDHWQWVDYWHPLEQIVAFKRNVYRQALTELEPILNANCVR